MGKYLLYAGGEIVLVVIGILIALSINTWNEGRKEDMKEQVILKRLEKEFLSNKEQLQSKIDIRNTVLYHCKLLLNYYNEPETATYEDVILSLSHILPTTFDPIQNDLVSSGNVEIIKDEELKQLLINWSTDVIQLQEVEVMFLNFADDDYQSYTIELGIMRDVGYDFWQQATGSLLEYNQEENPMPGKSKITPVGKIQLLSDPKLEGIIARSLNLNAFTNQEATTLMKRIDAILRLIELEIER